MSKPSATRRWPDILIGVLVLLLLGGFAALLLGQQRPAPTTVTPNTTDTATPDVQVAPGTADPSGGSAATGQDSATTAITPPADASTSGADTASTGTEGTGTDGAATASADAAAATPSTDQTTTEAPIIPAAPVGSAATTDTSAGPQTTPDATAAPDAQTQDAQTQDAQTSSTPDTQTPNTQTPQTQTPQTQITETPADQTPVTSAPRSGGAVATSAARTPLRSDYRISLGTFGSVGTAQSRTAPVSALGYTVYPIDLGSQVVAQVGPFADEATARQALSDVQRAYPGALLYRPRNPSGSTPAPASTPTTAAPANPAPSPAPTSTADAPTAPSGPVYLQVGAFDRVESAQKLVQELRDLGYVPTVNAPEGRKVTVAVGPYTGDALNRTENRLDDNNLDHFRVR